MTDFNFNEMADPEKLRSVIRQSFPGMDKEDVDDLVKDDELRSMMELSNKIHAWHKEFAEVRKANGKETENTDYIAAIMRVMAEYLMGYVNLDDPIRGISGARGINSMWIDVWAKSVVTVMEIRFKQRRRD